MKLSATTALVTGGASGLGLATARRLVRGGARVVVVDLPAAAEAPALVELGTAVTFVGADVRDEEQVQAAVEVADANGDLAVAVNCAGIGSGTRVVGRGGPHPLAEFQRVIDINLVGTFNVVRLASAAMSARAGDEEERGVIVNTASVAAFDGQIGQAAYAASKAGIAGLTLPLARDLAQHRIRVVTIAPGLFRTPLFETLPDNAVAALSAQVPHPSRLGEPDEYAALVEHVVSNPMLNGETIRLDGAIRMSPR